MKKLIIAILSGLALTLLFTTQALATTNISLAPQNINVIKGQNFDVVVALDPQGVKNYTAKIELQYPADLIEVKTFSFGNNWMALSESGYNLIDNNSGKLIKTAGYPAGFSAPVTFGTIVFSAKETGSGNIQVGADSFVYDANNQNVIGTSPIQTSITIAASVPAPTPTPASPTPTPNLNQTPSQTEETTQKPSAQVSETQETQGLAEQENNPSGKNSFGTTLLAAIGLAPFNWRFILILLVVAAIAVTVVWLVRERKKKKTA